MRSPTQEPIEMIRPPSFICFSAACVAIKTPRTLRLITRSRFVQRGLVELFGDRDAQIVHEHIEPAKRANGLVDRGLHGLGIRGIRLDRDRFSARAFDRLDHRSRHILALTLGDRHSSAIGSEPFCYGGADSAGAAGDECGLTFEFL
jgi:hypothetical protein